jgi:hypothetical protein
MSRIPSVPAGEPEYSIFSASSMEPLDSLELHVLARAYRAAWRSIHARDPVNGHLVESLDIMIVFGSPPNPGSPARSLRD